MAELRSDIFQATTGVAGIEDRDIALASRMVDQSPGIISAAGFMNYRGANTLIKGGRYDFLDAGAEGRAGRRAARLQRKYRVFDSSSQLVAPSAGNYVGGYNQKRGLFRRSTQNTRLMRRAEAKAAAAVGGTGSSIAGASNFQFRGTRVNYLTSNPKALGRYHSLSVFADQNAGAYSPFALGTMIGRTEGAKKYFTKRFELDKLVKGATPDSIIASNESIFGPGLLSFISAGRKADVLEAKALRGNKRAMRKLGRIDKNIEALAKMNNPALFSEKTIAGTLRHDLTKQLQVKGGQRVVIGGKVYTGGQFLPDGAAMLDVNTKTGRLHMKKGKTLDYGGKTYYGAGAGPAGRPGIKGASQMVPFEAQYRDVGVRFGTGMSVYDDAMRGADGIIGVRGNLMASSMAGSGTRYAAGYVRGAMGKSMLLRDASGAVLDRAGYQAAVSEGAVVKGLFGEALAGSQASIHTFGAALDQAGIKVGGKIGAEAAETALSQGVFKTLGRKGVFEAASTKAGAKVLATRAIGMALPGINLVMMASLVYDLGQMAGEVIKSGINLAKDANKSLQGSINKPLFGMGYKDTEAAATSRARGVMAIQNSRLNARSMLGSEAAMMAAHYG